ncbi:MAG: LysR family transcriptional regulator [Rhodobacter sp.]|uniref:LysR family transcriptional regulator n=1 Tax=Pararhodobacter sp. TaxID=2127056 RepID=UPI002BE57711|nr:LysR family transcriptional regulator [Pararhodobacter sp.]MCC0074126.1 LysR family transcriptional regulator [Rhodobacter sp.]HPD92221.1 LysR family transcriptional regulator [Pararhodobacter sp.]
MRFNGFDLNLLVAFRKLLETGSVSESARQLDMSQSAVSGALQRLRNQFGDELFVPSGHRMVPTARALDLAESAARLLAEAEAMTLGAGPFDPATSARRIVVSAADHLTDLLFAPMMRAVRSRAPHLRLELLPLLPGNWAMVETGEADVQIMPQEFLTPEQSNRLLLQDRYALLYDPAEGAPAPGRPVVAARLGAPRRHRGGLGHHSAARLLDRAEIVVTQFTQVPDLIEGSARVAVVPELYARLLCRRRPLAVAPLPDAPAIHVHAQFNRARQSDAGLSWFLDRLAETAATLT